MQEFQQLTPDEETFRRVWKRVMPDGENSPIALNTPVPRQEHSAAPLEEERMLRQLMEELDGAVHRTSVIARRVPGGRMLRESAAKSAARIRPLWFLVTGQRWHSRPRREERHVPTDHLLREQYLWEINFSRLCREGMGNGSEAAEEILPELAWESRKRRGMIRNLLSGG